MSNCLPHYTFFSFFLALYFPVTISSTAVLGHVFNTYNIPPIQANVHPSEPWLGTLPNVLRGQVASGTTYCREVARWIEVLVVWLQCETLDGCTENFRVPNSLSDWSVAARHGVLLSLTGL